VDKNALQNLMNKNEFKQHILPGLKPCNSVQIRRCFEKKISPLSLGSKASTARNEQYVAGKHK
jgi:hypothetical protein